MKFFLFLIICCNQLWCAPKSYFSTYDCARNTKAFKHLQYRNPNAPKGGIFRYGSLGSFDSLNAFIIKGNPVSAMLLCHATLMESAEDEPATMYAYVAETIDANEKNNTVTFKIRENAKFSDGKQITSADVKFSFDILISKGSPMYRSYYRVVEKCIIINEYEVRFKIRDWNKETPLILGQIPILPKHYYEKTPFDQSALVPPPVSGPYKVGFVRPGQQVTFERVKNWWGTDIPTQKGANNFDKIEFQYFRDDNALFEAFKRGLIDFRYENSSKRWAIGYDFPAFKAGHVIKKVYKTAFPKPTYGFFLNMRKKHLKDKRVRKALNQVFNFEWINKNIFHKIYKRNLSHFPVSPFEGNQKPDKNLKSVLLKAGYIESHDVMDGDFTLPAHANQADMRKAISDALQLMNEAGWHIANHRLEYKKTKEPFEIDFICRSPLTQNIALAYKSQLKRIGVELNVRLLDSASYEERLANFDYDMVFEVIPQSATPGNEQAAFFGSKSANISGSRNYAGLSNKKIDSLIYEVIESQTYKDLVENVKALDRALLFSYIMIPAWHFDGYMAAYWDKFGGNESMPAYAVTYYPFKSWWAKPVIAP